MTTTLKAIALAILSTVGAASAAQAEAPLAPATIKSTADHRWEPFAPGTPLTFVQLWGDRNSGGEYAILLKLPAGFSSGTHAHTNDYQGVNLQGTWIHTDPANPDEGGLPPGSLVTQPGLAMHDDSCKGPEDCILLIYQRGRGDFLPGPAAVK